MSGRRKKLNTSREVQPLDGESYTSRVDQHDADLDAIRDRIDVLESLSDADRLLDTINKDSRIKEKIEGWIWEVITQKARKVFLFILFAVIVLSLVNFVLERVWGKAWDFFVTPVVSSPKQQ